jgi:phosphatidyl-myo-inositol dimannoside synthase
MKSHGSLRVLLLAWNYPPALGGIEDVACHLADSLRQSGFDLRVIARAGVADDTCDVFRPKRSGLLRFLLFSLRRGLGCCIRSRPDVIVCPGIVDAPVGIFLARLFRCRLLLLAHGSDIAHGGRMYRFLVRTLFRRADGVSANSANTVRLLSELGCRPERIYLIHPGIDAHKFSLSTGSREALRERMGFSGRRVLLSAGRIIRRKGIHVFVRECLPELIRVFPDLLYVIVGGDAAESLVHREALLVQIKETVNHLGLANNVVITGSVSDLVLREYYQAADVFLMPAIEVPGDVEGFGIVLLEAAAAGVPTVATVCGGIPEAVVHSKTGLLVAPGDWCAMTEVLTKLFQDENCRMQLGRAARERALESFAWSVIGRQYQDTIQTLAGCQDRDGRDA